MATEAIRSGWSRLAASSVLVLSACGEAPAAAETTPSNGIPTVSPSTPTPSPKATPNPTPSPTPTPVAIHDFSAIEGTWEGIVGIGAIGAEEGRLVATIKSGATKNNLVGDGAWFEMSRTEPDCGVAWLALSANPPTYEVREINDSGCIGGTVTLVHDPEAETLKYTLLAEGGNPAFGARGTLERSEQ